MKVLRAEAMGFCFGVEDAIELAQLTAARAERVYSLGPLIHNRQVVDKLAETGLKTVESLDRVNDGTVVIRAHGVPPDTLAAAGSTGAEVVDATCVLVQRAQNAVKQLHEEGYRVVVLGDAEHPEVKGIVGYAPEVTVIADRDEMGKLPHAGRLGVVGQTTMSQDHFADMVRAVVARPFREVKVINTLCVEVVNRQRAALALCDQVDVVFVLGGLHSANTQELAHLCSKRGVPTHHLESWVSFRLEYVEGCSVAGVTAGASTPRWIIDEFVAELEATAPVPA
ncbi:MAG: 4-hydroxy-3-methylbut-2-enyl diphosphate reductase [bacterium]|nr:4-hydroxy-3-methylbut-2-enyl diphosphate reductase [bacterium]